MTPKPRIVRELALLGVLGFLVQIPFLERGISLLDEGYVLSVADALRQGDVMYVDRITPLAPLTFELNALLMKTFGPSLLVGRILQALIFTGCLLTVYLLLLRLVGRRGALGGFLALLATKPLGFPAWTMVNYSTTAMLLCMVSLLTFWEALRGRRTRWLLATGVGVGLTLLTKQNFGIVLAAAIAMTLALDAAYDGERTLGPLARRAAALGLGALLTLLLSVAYYAVPSAAEAFLSRTAMDMRGFAATYWIPPPDPLPWALRDEGVSAYLFSYFPPPLVILAWQGDLDLSWWPLALGIESCVKLAFYLPVLAAALTGAGAVKGWWSGHPRESWIGPVLVLIFAVGAYASSSYRLDWIHLMNIYPPMVILCVIAFLGNTSVWRRRAGAVALGLWLGLGLVMTGAVLWVYSVELATPRGRLLGARHQVAQVKPVLDHVASQPRSTKIAFLRGEALYYFVSGRTTPLALDLLMPGGVSPDDDDLVARQLGGVDQVIYNPEETPMVPGLITDYAPRVAAVLARDFRVERALGATALLLTRRAARASAGTSVLDVWDSSLNLGPAVERESWMTYRVLRVKVDPERPRSCFAIPVPAGPDDWLVATPLFHPSEWRGPARARTVFQVAAARGSEPPTVLHREARATGLPGEPFRVRLADHSTDPPTRVILCTSSGGDTALHAPGWAEVRLIRPEEAAPESSP